MTNVRSRSGPVEAAIPYDPAVEAYEATSQDITLVSVGNVLLRHRWLLILCMLAGFTIFGLATYVPYLTYTATTSFAPRSRGQQSLTSSVLSQLGLGGGGGGGGGGGAYYLEVVRSPRILGPVVESVYSYKTDTGTVTGRLIDIYGFGSAPKRNGRAQAINTLSNHIKTESPPGGIMKLSVTTSDPSLSAQIARRMLQEINEFNLGTRQEQASAERQFIELRTAEAKVALSDAENALQRFTNENQFFSPISPLSLEFDRLKREVGLRQALYTELAKAADQARIEEVRSSPVLTVIEPAEPPLGPDSQVWRKKAMLGALIGLFLGIILAFLHSYVTKTRETYSDEYAELERLKRETANDFRHPWKPLAKIFATGRP